MLDESLPRGFWKLGRIQEVIAGRDGKIRGASEISYKEPPAPPVTPTDAAALPVGGTQPAGGSN